MSERPRLDPELFEYLPNFLTQDEADRALECLWAELEWSRREIVLFGRRVFQPRLVAWYGEPDAIYSYSGLTLDPLPWHPMLRSLKNRIEEVSGVRFNSVLANAYRDGGDSMGWHSDDEKELGPEPAIASLSLGASRRFLLRPRSGGAAGTADPVVLPLGHGSLLLMKGESQRRFQHCLPKTRREMGLRVNLTYRMVLAQAPV